MSDLGDNPLSLEAIYYSAQIPRDLATLTVLGAVFDKVYFPGVYLPKDGFDQAELDKEIARIEALTQVRDRDDLFGVLRFVRHVAVLDGFCVFTGSRNDPFKQNNTIPQKMVDEIYETIHGPSRPGWHPLFSTTHHKAVPGSDEHVTYPGSYHYFAGAILESARTGIPIINDLPGLPIPGLENAVPKDDAKTLSTILAIESAKLVLPHLPLLRPSDLMEFREENAIHLRRFRASMLRYAADLNGRLSDITPKEFERRTADRLCQSLDR